MGLSATISNAVKSAMLAVGDLKVPVTAFAISGDPVYDASTGEYTSDLISDVDILAILYEFESNERPEGFVFSTDQKLLIETRSLVNVNKPEYFAIAGVRWDVITPERVPGDSIRIFYIRDTGLPT